MQKKLLGGIIFVLVISGLMLLGSCAKEAVQATTPEEPTQATEVEDDNAAAEEAARREAEQRAMEEEAIRR